MRIIWEESLHEAFCRSGWVRGMPLGYCYSSSIDVESSNLLRVASFPGFEEKGESKMRTEDDQMWSQMWVWAPASTFSLLESHVITGYESWLLYSVFVRVLCHRPGQETKTHLIFLLSQGSLQSKWGISSSSSHKSSSRLPLHFTLHHDLKASFGCNLLQSRTLLCSLNHPSHPELCFRLKG